MKNPNESISLIRLGMSFFLTDTTEIIYGGKGKSYPPFFVKYDLLGLSDKVLEIKLNEIIKRLEENEVNIAKSTLSNLK
ncbi:hypothetical protein IQ37_02265 [Chryseobacterium piperi]|uniref:Uncharacterized protein n=1 Tax=Chryseobacterium piperi TaxID=558152 RepID=A0A086BM53_9FLAO|nr:hypothetical protein [Chryseobacterium piperi]ASW75381.1 hypothetical protein CJF12_14530 [Chryseobacterium piperi]KFF30017.1 hypothetical protein IQ37_02265 [Chryseobacterium piperi]